MRTAEEIERLEAAAAQWVGTPFCANAATKGSGVSCHQLVAAVYCDAGWLPKLTLPGGSPRWASGSNRSLIEDWLDGKEGREYFSPDGTPESPGTLLGFRIGHCVHHLAIALSGGRIVHCVQGHGVSIVEGIPSVWMRRLVRAWTPIPSHP